MDENSATVEVFECDDGLLLFGAEDALSAFEVQTQVKTAKVPSHAMARAGRAFGALSQLQEASGRWVKLDKESAAAVKASGKLKNLTSGVLRTPDGRIAKHLKFENAALLTPAGTAVVATMATQVALESALEDIQEYLEDIDAKLDVLLKQRRVEVLGQMGGVALSIEEARTIYAETGHVSEVTWSKVQANDLALKTMLAEAIAQLNALADEIKSAASDKDRSAKAMARAQDDAPFWLGVLARSLAMQDRQHVMELARVADQDADQLESHRQGIRVARRERAVRITQALEAINASVGKSGHLSNLRRVTSPGNARQVTRGARSVTQDVSRFAQHAGLDLAGVDLLEDPSWRRAARALAGEAVTVVGSAGTQAASTPGG